MNVCTFIHKSEVPQGQKVTYPRTVVAHRPEKIKNPDRTRITAGGNQLEYDSEAATRSASYPTIKLHWNSVLSAALARYAVADAGNMYLESLLKTPQYVRFKLN